MKVLNRYDFFIEMRGEKELKKRSFGIICFLFLIFTMSAFSVVLTLMGIYTVSRVRNSQTQYVNNLADSLLEQLQSGSSLDELDLTYYAKQLCMLQMEKAKWIVVPYWVKKQRS